MAQHHRFSSNTGLLDGRGTGQILSSLSARFSAVEFADFCTVSEEIVLRDQVLIVGKLDKLPRPLRLALRPLFDAKVFFSLAEAFHVPELPSDLRQLNATVWAIERGFTTTSAQDATYEARRLLGGEAHFGIPATPLLRQLQHFGLVQRPCIENTVWDLAAQYHRLAGRAEGVRRHLQSVAALPHVSLPPIALRAMQRSKTFEGVIAEVLQLRQEFAPLREHLRDIEDRIRDGRMSPADALELESAWRSRWDRLAEKLDASNGRMAIARTSLPLLKNGIEIVRGAVDKSPVDVLTAVASWIGPGCDALGGLQVRPVHRSVSNYLKTTNQDMLRAVARIFATDFVRIDSDMRSLANQQGNPWRLALEAAPFLREPPHNPRPSPKSAISSANSRNAVLQGREQVRTFPLAGHRS